MSSRNRNSFFACFMAVALLWSGSVFASGTVGRGRGQDGDDPARSYREVMFGWRADKTTLTKIASDVSSLGVVYKSFPQITAIRLRLKGTVTSDAAVAQLKARADVRYASKVEIGQVRVDSVPNDPLYVNQYNTHITQTDRAWPRWNPKQQMILAVIDTGVDTTHPDLKRKILRDASGVVQGRDIVKFPMGGTGDTIDDNGHGTHCAGIAAAQSNNGEGIAGVAGWDGFNADTDANYVKIMPIKVLRSDGIGEFPDVAEGILYAADHGANVISMSLGGSGNDATVADAVTYAQGKNCLVVAAAGNSGSNAKHYPAALSGVLSVAATDQFDQLTYFSNFGPWVKTAAPGLQIYSTLPRGYSPLGDRYGYLSGTSQACPLVAGEAMLLWTSAPSLTAQQVSDLITSNVDTYFQYYFNPADPTFGRIAPGGGRVNVFSALNAIASTTDLLWYNHALGALALWHIEGGEILSSTTLATDISTDWTLAGTSDLNGDGERDIVFQNSKTGEVWGWLMKNRVLTQSYWVGIKVPSTMLVIGLADLLLKGSDDLIWRDTKTGDIDYSLMDFGSVRINANGTLAAAQPAALQLVGSTDITDAVSTSSTGLPGLTFYNTATKALLGWEFDYSTTSPSGAPVLKSKTPFDAGITVPATYVVIAYLDANGDGIADIVYQDTKTGFVYFYTPDGSLGAVPLPLNAGVPPGWKLIGNL